MYQGKHCARCVEQMYCEKHDKVETPEQVPVIGMADWAEAMIWGGTKNIPPILRNRKV